MEDKINDFLNSVKKSDYYKECLEDIEKAYSNGIITDNEKERFIFEFKLEVFKNSLNSINIDIK